MLLYAPGCATGPQNLHSKEIGEVLFAFGVRFYLFIFRKSLCSICYFSRSKVKAGAKGESNFNTHFNQVLIEAEIWTNHLLNCLSAELTPIGLN